MPYNYIIDQPLSLYRCGLEDSHVVSHLTDDTLGLFDI